MRIIAFLPLLLLSACASTPEMDPGAEALAQATDECLADPELAKEWGECNVKKTIFDRSKQIRACQSKHIRNPGSGEVLMLKISVHPSGTVRNVVAEGLGPKNRPLEGCLAQALSKLKFAPPPRGVKPVIYFPFEQ